MVNFEENYYRYCPTMPGSGIFAVITIDISTYEQQENSALYVKKVTFNVFFMNSAIIYGPERIFPSIPVFGDRTDTANRQRPESQYTGMPVIPLTTTLRHISNSKKKENKTKQNKTITEDILTRNGYLLFSFQTAGRFSIAKSPQSPCQG
jgi:hypothetical protein